MTTEDQGREPEAGGTPWRPATGDSPYEPATRLPPAGATARRDPKRRRASKAIVIGGTLALAAAMTGVAVTSQSSQSSIESAPAEENGWTNEFGETVAAPAELEQDYAQVCQDTQTGERIDDQWCEDPSIAEGQAAQGQEQAAEGEGQAAEGEEQQTSHYGGGYGWFFIPLSGGRTVPAVGSPLRDGTTQAPAGRSVTKVPASGGSFAKAGTVSKGGFGTKGGGAGS